jgi:tetratricopeptide (TPR) repeat protein
MAYLAAGKTEEAQRMSESLTARSENDDQLGEDTYRRINVLEGRVLFATGEVDRAIELLEKEARIANNPNPELYAGLAEAYGADERWAESEVALRRLIEVRWDSYEELSSWIVSHFLLGQVCERLGKTDEAVASYRRFIDLWGEADTELPQIELARQRLDALGS